MSKQAIHFQVCGKRFNGQGYCSVCILGISSYFRFKAVIPEEHKIVGFQRSAYIVVTTGMVLRKTPEGIQRNVIVR